MYILVQKLNEEQRADLWAALVVAGISCEKFKPYSTVWYFTLYRTLMGTLQSVDTIKRYTEGNYMEVG